MNDKQIALPYRGKGDKRQVETRPMYVEEWLDSLPYIDFHNTCNALYAALQGTNKVPMKSNQRMELIRLYNRPYEYYLNSQISSGAQHTLQSIETMQTQLEDMKRLAIALAHASRKTIDDVASHKSLWGQTKPPLQSMLQAINYLSHALIFSYLEYSPPAKNVWFQLHYMYKFAETLKQEKTPFDLSGSKSKGNTTTAERLYRRILLVSLADPYHLPFGAVWEIYEQVNQWADKTALREFARVTDPTGVFVINKDKDSGPIPYEKFDTSKAGKSHHIIDTNGLLPVVEKHIQSTSSGKEDPDLTFSSYYAKSLLTIIYKAWSLPPKRYAPRQTSSGKLGISHGLNATYYFINNNEDFVEKPTGPQENDEDVVVGEDKIPLDNPVRQYDLESWNLVDKSSGGLAILKNRRPGTGIRVGDLIGFSPKGSSNAEHGWVVGVLRWLLVKPDSAYRAGVQALSKKMLPGAIRVPAGNTLERTWSRALLSEHPAKNREILVITNRGLYGKGRRIELEYNGTVYTGTITSLNESTVGFERFGIQC